MKQFLGNASQATAALHQAFLDTLKNGCIGVAAVVAGYSGIGDFKKQLNQGYWIEAKAKEAMKKMHLWFVVPEKAYNEK